MWYIKTYNAFIPCTGPSPLVYAYGASCKQMEPLSKLLDYSPSALKWRFLICSINGLQCWNAATFIFIQVIKNLVNSSLVAIILKIYLLNSNTAPLQSIDFLTWLNKTVWRCFIIISLCLVLWCKTIAITWSGHDQWVIQRSKFHTIATN